MLNEEWQYPLVPVSAKDQIFTLKFELIKKKKETSELKA